VPGAWDCSHPPATDCGPGAAWPRHGRVHAIEHLRLILGEHKIANARSPATLIFGEEFRGNAESTPRSLQEQRVTAMPRRTHSMVIGDQDTSPTDRQMTRVRPLGVLPSG
jgi:hypothetical protein